jgi:hypothetical protein
MHRDNVGLREVFASGLPLIYLHGVVPGRYLAVWPVYIIDRFIIGVSANYLIHVRSDVLDEEDSPMLQHGLKELHNMKLVLPVRREQWPSQEALERRFDQFKSVLIH